MTGPAYLRSSASSFFAIYMLVTPNIDSTGFLKNNVCMYSVIYLTEVRRIFPDVIHRSLLWYDINHLFTLKFEMINCSPPSEASNIMQECLVLASEYAEQTEMMGTDGSLRYLQDTSAAQLSSFGMSSYKVSTPLTLGRKKPTSNT